MNRRPPWAAWSAHAVAPTWAFVAVALLLWAGLALGLTPHWQQQTAAAEQAAQAARTAAGAAKARAAALARQRPKSGQAALPLGHQRDVRTAALLQLALDLGLTVDSLAQRAQPAEGGVEPHELNLTARGSYSALRRFVEAALANDAALALRQLDLGRQAPASSLLQTRPQAQLHAQPQAQPQARLQAQLQFVLLQRVEPAP